MKTVALPLIVCLVGLMAGTAMGQTIVGSAHDFSASGWAAGEICITCHTPHNAVDPTAGPLWNHELSTATYTLYSSSTLDATMGQPDGNSKLCLCCHDGTVALDSYGGATGTTFLTGSAMLDDDLSDDHPISFTYNTALATSDGELFDPSVKVSGLGGTIDADMLYSNKMQCASCHDVHNTAFSYMLLKANTASALCLTCHDK